jgi:hypothetical protein
MSASPDSSCAFSQGSVNLCHRRVDLVTLHDQGRREAQDIAVSFTSENAPFQQG